MYVGQLYEREIGQGEMTVPDPGFESGGQWSHVPSSSWPGTSIWRGTWGSSAPHSGSYAESISNLASGYARSPFITVSPGTDYELSVYARGEIDPDDSQNKWYLRAYWYDASGNALANPNTYTDACSSASVGASWTQYTGSVTAPAGAYKLKVMLYNSLLSGWVAFDDVAVKQESNTLYSFGFESATWEEVVSTHPGTSIWRGMEWIASPHLGNYALAISNLHFGWISAPLVAVTPGQSYDVAVYGRGEIDPDSSPGASLGGRWIIRVDWYDADGNCIGTSIDLRSQDTIGASWTLYSNSFTPPAGAYKALVGIGSELQSGWLAFDDLSIKRGALTLYSTGFESGDATWSSNKSSEFPATSIWNGSWGTAAPRSGSQAVAISNHVYGYLNSPELAVQPSTTYHVNVWLRGEIDSEESAGKWKLRAYYYDANHAALSYTDPDEGSTVSASWTEEGGDFTTPSNAAYVRLQLYHYLNSGWVAWDDVSLTGPAVTTQYYYAGGQRVAMRKNGVLHYLLGDHLGSTALTAYDDGVRGAELRYRAWGETRFAWESTPTTYRFTGQREDATIQLLFYNARYY